MLDPEIIALFDARKRAHRDRNADAAVAGFAPDALLYTLAPPLAQSGIDRDGVATWMATWDSPIEIDTADLDGTTEGDLACATALCRMRGTQGDREIDLWYRSTTVLRRIDGRWRIVHEHTSVPFLMDGSDKAALDLRPDGR